MAEEAIEQDAELKAHHEEVMALYESKLKEKGFPSEAELKELTEMRQRIQNPGEMEEAEVEQMKQEFNTEVRELQRIEREVKQDPEVRQAVEGLAEERTEVLAEMYPESEELQQELEQISMKLQQMQRQMQQMAAPAGS